MRYQDLVIHVDADGSGTGYKIRVAGSPAGQGSSVPLSEADFEALRAEAGRLAAVSRTAPTPSREGSSPTRHVRVRARSSDAIRIRRLGERFFSTLLSGVARGRFDESLGKVGRSSKEGLRISLEADLGDPRIACFHQLPWELLRHPETGDFLCLKRSSPLVRYLELPRGGEPPEATSPLRILLVASSPRGLPPLELEREKRQLQSFWRRPRAELLGRARLEDLRDELLEAERASHPYHVLHFMGHGGFDDASGQGVLYFQDEEGEADPVDGEALAIQLEDFGDLRLVVLNACETARASDPDGFHPFAGVVPALVRGGVSAVVAMQSTIGDRAAVAFSRQLYKRLAAGDRLETAVTEGRLAIHRERSALAGEWAVPVLFTRSRDDVWVRPRPRSRRLAVAAALVVLVLLVAALRNPRPPESPAEDGVLRVAIETFNEPPPGATRFPELLSEGTRKALQEKLVMAGGQVQVVCIDCPQIDVASRRRLALDYSLRGELVTFGRPRLEARLFDYEGVFQGPPIQVAGPVRDNVASIQRLQGEMALALLERLSVTVDPATAARIRGVPTSVPEARDFNNQGVRWIDEKRFDEAESALSKALEADPDMSFAWANLARAVEGQGRYDEAIAYYGEAIDRLPEYQIFHLNLGSLHGRLDEPALALESLRRAVSLDPGYVSAYAQLGRVYLDLERWQDAERELRKGLIHDPRHSTVLKLLGLAASGRGALDEAVVLFEQALEHHRRTPDDDPTWFAEIYYQLAEGRAALGEPTAACRQIARIAPLDPLGVGQWSWHARRLAGELDCQGRPESSAGGAESEAS